MRYRSLPKISCLAITLILLAGWPGPTRAERPVAQSLATPGTGQVLSVRIERDVEYGKVDGKSLKLDAYLPDQPGPHPVVISIHGGGWRGGDKAGQRNKGTWYARNGIAAFSLNYRLSSEATYPAAVEDCLRAVRWVRQQASKYELNVDRMGVEGGSAGGHLALMVGLMEPEKGEVDSAGRPLRNWVRCVVAKNPPTDLTQLGSKVKQDPLVLFMGGNYAEMPERYQAASPVTYVSDDDPPVLLIHGTEDRAVPYSQSVTLKQRLEEAKVPVELITVEGAGHGLKGGSREDIWAARRRAEEFMLKYLLGEQPD